VHFVVAFFEGADGDVAVLPKPLILNPAGTEGQGLINALMATELSIGWPETGRVGNARETGCWTSPVCQLCARVHQAIWATGIERVD
jgi:hypothetical protein